MTSRQAFGDLDKYLELPRVAGLAVSPDGTRLVTSISEINDDHTEFVTAIWELDPAGQRPAQRLTHGATGESSPAFTGGDLLFVAARPAQNAEKPPAALWRLPGTGGEAVQLLAPPGGVSAVHTAAAADRVIVTAPLLPSAVTVEDDTRLRALRKDKKVSAILHTGYPVRYWDHDLGPDQPRLLDVAGARDLTPSAGAALREAGVAVSADGTFAVTTWQGPGPGASIRIALVRIDTGSGERRVIAEDPDADLSHPAISPDGARLAFLRETVSTPEHAPRTTLCVMTFGESWVEVSSQWDRWPSSVSWTADGTALVVTADDGGRCPIFSVDPDTGAVTRLTCDDHSYTDVRCAPGGVLYALRHSYSAPPHPVRIDPTGAVIALPCVQMPELPGTLEEITASAEDGTPVRSWLVLPQGGRPAPLLLWVHGGPLGSWNAWHWRWNPWLLAAAGYAVLMPDPALSTGYGQEFVQRGWGAWGEAPYTDLMAATDAACAHPRVDATRTAVMGGSFGGYMANWIAGHTDRFDAIVTHAGLWALDQFGHTTDGAYWWAREMTEHMTQHNSPHRSVGAIRTPMLVIHGDKDFRVPIGEALRLWYELLADSASPADDAGESPHRFLYFPDEGHWIASPQHTKVWYQVIIAFLARQVLGEDGTLPDTLG